MSYRDFHVHIEQGPYTLKWLKKFIEKAKERNIEEIGISEHIYRFVQAKNIWKGGPIRNEWHEKRATEDIEEYISLIEKAKKEGFPVKLGIEADYFPENEEIIREFIKDYPFDFVIGSVHWLSEFGFDNPERIKDWEGRDIDKVYEEYYITLISAVKSGIFDFIAHPDLVKIFNYRSKADLSNIYGNLAEEIKSKNMCIEVSTAGLRKPVKEIYPSEDLMYYFSKFDIPVILNSDAHCPEDVGKDFEKAVKYIKSFGFDKLCYFENRKRMQYEIREE
ncbi:histidinol-phosphatase HisJ family protein [Thermovenabulum gondwanense]|uniref:Histidinol-phosphatase n=1 Tax=Thermovenabulum gondwanense TaxID=520767 RepID=A0A161Q986_9FIRM|nr:histidinol-phosphatase HisJ family protein [Thermovenabulum gondwanense]KYO63814.1 Histidinol-phosphatase [Thermovenabulum gondwanense]